MAKLEKVKHGSTANENLEKPINTGILRPDDATPKRQEKNSFQKIWRRLAASQTTCSEWHWKGDFLMKSRVL
ncbi:hypothetical protein K737_301103 [Holospora undulata HU1]|uniref:Uncharacterized protein n=1 Tax=Holospora undulata HU1 TaxID=1321371 RepID=A0A061JGU6_9PROT|nr:hypothetical protein K737_301103 [Holospora undulata HU1]